MRVLIACEYSGIVRSQFRARGHDAWSCDVLPTIDGSPFHIQDDVLRHLRDGWDMVVAHPPCTYLSSSGLHWNRRRPGRAEKTEEALRFVAAFLEADIDRVCVENPDGCIGTRLLDALGIHKFRRQRFQPYMLGEDASKWTCLYIKGLDPIELLPKDQWHPGRWVEWPKGSGKMVQRWSNQTDSGQNRLGPSETRGLDRAKTYIAVARAMGQKWGTDELKFRLEAA